MRIVFVGAVEFSRYCLEAVLKNGGDVVAVLTLPKEHAGFHSDYADLSDVAIQHGITVYRLNNINNAENVKLIQSLSPDIIFVFGWSQLISKRILDIPPMGCIGTHPALLPRNRGRHPIVWALAEGLEESGLTFFYLDEGADSGDILCQRPFPITREDDARALYEKIKGLASEAIAEFLPKLEQGIAPRVPQDHSQATYWRKRTGKDGEIDWAAPTVKIYNLIRALARPYVGAHTYAAGRKVTIWRAILPRRPLPTKADGVAPGTVFTTAGKGLAVRTGDGYLKICGYELEGQGALEAGTGLGTSE
jgi:methionyl-tRNA formyltransferase